MKLPLSLHARIALLAMAMVAAVIAFSVGAISSVIEGAVADNIDVKMDTQIRILSHALDGGQRLMPAALHAYVDLDHPPAGWGWDVQTPGGHWARGVMPGAVEYPIPRIHPDGDIYSGRGTSNDGHLIRIRRIDPGASSPGTRILVISPRHLIDRELTRVLREVYKVMAQVMLVLIVATALQLRVGLRPLRKLVQDVARVRNGQAPRLPERQPADIQPLASEINALVDRNRAGLETARLNAAHLAHAVKTPLATLMLQLEHEDASQEARALVTSVAERVAHHLHRARSAAIRLGPRARTQVAPVACEVVSTMRLIHRHRAIAIATALDSPCAVAVDSEDLAEMLGNLVDNAARYAHSRVTISAQEQGEELILTVEDDGDGIPADELAHALTPGVRLEDASEGYGFGLSIVRDLAQLYGGSLILESADGGGLKARLNLPL